MTWLLDRARGPAGSLHDRVVAAARSVTVCEVERPAVVLGRAQPAEDVDVARASARGVEVARRRSGGGAVLLVPGRVVWIDVVVPAGDRLWLDDVGHAFWWLGEVWAETLRSLGVPAPAVHRGGLRAAPWSAKVCFAGLGPGEVSVGEAKVVGVSQRRTRDAALFQCGCLLEWDPAPLLDVLALSDEERAAAAVALTGAGLGIGGGGVDSEAVEAAFIAALPG
ncbi:MAG: lipoate---protein ligase [Acidimicrobiaceae bacterium]|nr:lipoate---protein ligase [Acidimicrobiaceae bacterium]